MERDAWIMVAAQVPDEIDAIMALKQAELDHPDMQTFYRLVSQVLDGPPEHPRVVELADVLERIMTRAVEAGETGPGWADDGFVDLLDATTANSSPVAVRLLSILEERGWRGWTRIERAPVRERAVESAWT